MTGLNVNWDQIGSILVLLFVISLVFETALTPVFNWRFFAKLGLRSPDKLAAKAAQARGQAAQAPARPGPQASNG